jgi:hypothetical protein
VVELGWCRTASNCMAVAVASLARTTSNGIVKPCASMIASVQPSRQALNDSSAQRRAVLLAVCHRRATQRRSLIRDFEPRQLEGRTRKSGGLGAATGYKLDTNRAG